MKQRVKKMRIKDLALRCGFVALMLGLIVFSIYQLTRHLSAGVPTLRTQTITDRSYLQMDVYLFRDETVLVTDRSDGVFVYQVGDGEKVGVGDTLAHVYAADLGTAERLTLQQSLNGYSEQIALFKKHQGAGNQTDAKHALDSVDRQYMGMLSAMDKGQLGMADGYAEQMAEDLNRYQVLTGMSESTGSTVGRLTAEQTALVAGCARLGDAVTDDGGYFYYEVDGYEARFPYESVMTMTASEFLSMTEESGSEQKDVSVMGKLVRSSTWYAATYLAADEAAFLEVGATYSMACRSKGDVVLPMTVCRMAADEGGVLVVFETQSMPDSFSYDRRLSLQTVSEEVSGYRVPTTAVVTRQNEEGKEEEGVYILVGNTVEFRQILKRRECEGYLIVLTNREVADHFAEMGIEGGTSGYLNLNDLILLTPTGYAEGDRLK